MTSTYEVAAGVIPVLLLVLATQEKLGFVKPEWRRSGRLHLVALLLGALIVGEVIALAAIQRQRAPTATAAYLLVVIAGALALIAWGIGWSIWKAFPTDVPAAGSLAKKAFYTIGLATLAGLVGATCWAFI